ncbi:MAG: M15 family metallopeptidase [Bacteroidetes bacterium]|nr:M15 family metallopeptidase [Bacteroidota bacterium]
MKKILFLILFFQSCLFAQTNFDKMNKLYKSYPDFIDSASNNTIYFKDGSTMQFDDGVEKDYETMLDNPDIEDMLSMKYTPGSEWDSPPPKNFEPGRIRNEDFFAKMYGGSAKEVESNLVGIKWMPKSTNATVMITRVNGVDKKLKEVSDELDALPENLKKYVTTTAGTFNWRPIAGTNRMSMHSYGVAIDINTKYSDYWQWNKSMKYVNRIPMEIVEIFEKHGFIWGGKWYHYDTMHFEYRPELLP